MEDSKRVEPRRAFVQQLRNDSDTQRWRMTHTSWAAFLRDRYDLSASTVGHWLAWLEVAENLEPVIGPVRMNETPVLSDAMRREFLR